MRWLTGFSRLPSLYVIFMIFEIGDYLTKSASSASVANSAGKWAMKAVALLIPFSINWTAGAVADLQYPMSDLGIKGQNTHLCGTASPSPCYPSTGLGKDGMEGCLRACHGTRRRPAIFGIFLRSCRLFQTGRAACLLPMLQAHQAEDRTGKLDGESGKLLHGLRSAEAIKRRKRSAAGRMAP